MGDSSFYDLYIPSLDDIRRKLSEDLATSFEYVECSVILCPDLTQKPFCLNTKGICGNVIVADVGGVGNLLPQPKLHKIYDMRDIAAMHSRDETFICGAGAGPFHISNANCEMVPMVKFDKGKVTSNKTLLAIIRNEENYTFDTDSTEFGILGQFHCSEGKTGDVLKIELRRRIKDGSVLSFIQDSLTTHFGDKPASVYISGIVLLESGVAKIHVMSDFIDEPLDTDEKVNNWLRFFQVPAPFIGFSVIGSHDPLNLGLRLEHCHGFTCDRRIAGHFHGDVTPAIVEYTAYFVVAEKCLRQDKI